MQHKRAKTGQITSVTNIKEMSTLRINSDIEYYSICLHEVKGLTNNVRFTRSKCLTLSYTLTL